MKRLSLCLYLTLTLGFGLAQTYVELILDASGSMWNTLDDGRYRIVAAKDVLSQFVASLPEDNLNVGLRIYGSQLGALEEGACDDSQLFVPLAGLDKAALSQTVQNTDALGATPIAKSLLAAADDFPAQADKRLIVLVTDGEESCGGDLQAVAADLRARGFDIDIRIIGFDLSAQAAASFEGIGSFENAEDAEELAQALSSAIADVVEAPEVVNDCDAEASLMAADAVNASYPFSVTSAGPEGLLSLHPVGGDAYSSLDTAYLARASTVELLAPSQAGSYELRYTATRGSCVIASLRIDVTAVSVSLSTPEQVEGGFDFAIDFEGPEGRIAIFEPGDDNYQNYNQFSYYVSQWDDKSLLAPSQAGNYEVRYYDNNGGLLTTNSIEVIAATVRLDSPESIEAGYEFTINFLGPEGRIAIYEPGDTSFNNYTDYSYYFTQWDDRVLTAPTEAGSYELRYYDENESLLVSNTLEVTASAAQLNAPESIEAGYEFAIDFSGPEGRIAIYEPGDTSFNNYTDYSYYFTQWDDRVLTAPTEAGSYELRYYDENGGLLVSRSLEVTPTQASLTIATSVEAGYSFPIDFSGPAGRIAIYEPGDTNFNNYTDYSYYFTQWDDKVLTAPTEAGSYELRYYDENGGLLTSMVLNVTPTTASLEVPAEVAAGADFSFSFSGPEGRIAIYVPADTDYNNYNDYSYYFTAWDNIKLTAPEQAGSYEVRYYDENGGLLVSTAIVVR